MYKSQLYGFGDYSYDDNDKNIIVKGIDHTISNDIKYQAHIVTYEESKNNYDESKFIGQKYL